MDESSLAAAPNSGNTSGNSDIATFEELAADPEIAALLEFEPAPRQNKRRDGWTPALQKRFIAQLAHCGSANIAADAVGKNRHGVEKVYKSAGAESFAAAWDGAVALFDEREAKRREALHLDRSRARPPGINHRRTASASDGPHPGEVMNEYGEWEDSGSYAERAGEAEDSIAGKLLRIRRLYLQEISDCPGKRAAFEILTELPIDWDKAGRGEAQDDEPWRDANQHDPDMVLLAESGWSFGEIGYGPDRKAQARAAMDRYLAKHGLPPVEWN